jgi:hypothetical protein
MTVAPDRETRSLSICGAKRTNANDEMQGAKPVTVFRSVRPPRQASRAAPTLNTL